MPGVKTEFELNPDLLTVPVGFHEPRLRTAGLAWLDMAVALFNDEVFSHLELTWFRPTDTVPKLVISLDSSKNFRTKAMLKCPDAPALIYNRRARLNIALEKLMSRTTPEDLWAALANQRLAHIGAWDFLQAWSDVVGPEAAKKSYPRLGSAEELLFRMMNSMEKDTHPWL
jgi:hypothetical protein